MLMDDVVSQLRVAIALASDPLIVRHDPACVATAFEQAFHRIDGLRAWADHTETPVRSLQASAIIDPGVKQLVWFALEKQLDPFKRPLPRIVQKDFKTYRNAPAGDEHENLVEREIKETNAAAAVVLLYYYLEWHLVLIVANSMTSKKGRDRVAKIEAAMARLPGPADLLEYRHVGAALAKAGDAARRLAALKALHDAGATANLMLNESRTAADALHYRDRKTPLVVMYARMLEMFTKDQPAMFFALANPSDLNALFESTRLQYTHLHLKLFAGVTSTFHIYDSAKKWADMYAETHVQAMATNGNLAKYTFFLQKVLSSSPYTEASADGNDPWRDKAVPMAIHDYNSSTLMVDICKSAAQLHKLLKSLLFYAATNRRGDGVAAPDPPPAQTALLLAQFFAQDAPAITSNLRNQANATPREDSAFDSFIAPTPTTVRTDNTLPIAIGPTRPQHSCVADFPSYYVATGAINLSNENHLFISQPGVATDETEATLETRINHVLHDEVPSGRNAKETVASLWRNSLYVTYGIVTATALLDAIQDNPLLGGGDVQHPAAELFQNVGTVAPKGIGGDEIRERLQAEVAAYNARKSRYYATAKQSQLLPGFSWPVVTTNTTNTAKSTNHGAFTRQGYIPRVLHGTRVEMVRAIRDVETAIRDGSASLAHTPRVASAGSSRPAAESDIAPAP